MSKRAGRSKSASRLKAVETSPAAPPAPSRKPRSKSANDAIGRLVAQVKQKYVAKTKKNEAIQRVEETIKSRFIDYAEYFDKDNIMAELISEHKGNFKRMDIELTAQHTVATNNLHRLVFQHSNDFLNLFRDIHKAHGLVDELKKDVQNTRSIIATLSKLTFSKESDSVSSSSTSTRGPVAGASGAIRTTTRQTRARASMLTDAHAGVLMWSFNPTHHVQCSSFLLTQSLVELPFTGPPPPTTSAEANKNVQMFRDVFLEEVRQRIGELNLISAGEWIAQLEKQAIEKGLLPVVLQLEEELADAIRIQVLRLPMTYTYFDALQLPLLKLLVQLGRVQTSTDLYLQLHSSWIMSELSAMHTAVASQHFCLVATDALVTLIQHTLQGINKLGIVVSGGNNTTSSTSKKTQHSVNSPGPSSAGSIIANAQVILWVRREIETFTKDVLAARILSVNLSDVSDASSLSAAVRIISSCVQRVKTLEALGIPHSDTNLVLNLIAPIRVLLLDLSRRTGKRLSSTSQTLINAVKLAIRNFATPVKQPAMFDDILNDARQFNNKFAQRFLHFAPTSQLQLLMMLVSPPSCSVFQSPLSQRITSEFAQEVVRRGLGSDPFVWSSRLVRSILIGACTAVQTQSRGSTAYNAALLQEAIQVLQDPHVKSIPRMYRQTVVDALASYRFTTLGLQKAVDSVNEERAAFLNAVSGGAGSNALVTPAVLDNLLTRSDIATPHWSRLVRDVFADALENRSNQIQASLNTLFQILNSHAGTNPITLTHRKIIMNVLRNLRFTSSDLPEDLVERMDAVHLAWILSPSCPTDHWSLSGPREFLADVFQAQSGGTSKYDAMIKLLRSDDVVDTISRNAMTSELNGILQNAVDFERTLQASGDVPLTLQEVKLAITPANVVAGKWSRKIRDVLAMALEKRYSGSSSFAKIADATRKLRDPLPIRLGIDDRRAVAVQLAIKSDDYIAASIAAQCDVADDSLQREEMSAVALLSSDHLTFLLARQDIGVPYWSRATRDAFADALECIQHRSTSNVHQSLIDLLRNNPPTKKLSVEQRKEIRDVLKRKVEGEFCSSSTKEVAVQQWIRITPPYLQRIVFSHQTGLASEIPSGSPGSTSTSAGDVWCSLIRSAVSSALRAMVKHWHTLIESLRGPTRDRIYKEQRQDLSKLLAGYSFTQNDIAKYASGKGADSLAKKLSTKASVSSEEFAPILTKYCGPSQFFHSAARTVLSLFASLRGSGLLPGEGARSTKGALVRSDMSTTVGSETSSSFSTDAANFILSNAIIAEEVDFALAAVFSSVIDILQRDINGLRKAEGHPSMQQGAKSVASWVSSTSMTTTLCSASRWMCFASVSCTWAFNCLFAVLVDALSIHTLYDYVQSPQGLAQILGEGIPMRVVETRRVCRDKGVLFLNNLLQRVLLSAVVGPLPNDVTDIPARLRTELLALIKLPYYGSNVSLTDVTVPPRLAGIIPPIEGFNAWRVTTTIPTYPSFSFASSSDDEAYLFHLAVQISLNVMTIFQEVLLRDFSSPSNTDNPNDDSSAFLAKVIPGDSSSMQHWVALKAGGTNLVAAVAILQSLTLEIVRTLFSEASSPLLTMYGSAVTSAKGPSSNPRAAKQILTFGGIMYFMWAPLFSSTFQSSLLAQGFLSSDGQAPSANTNTTANKSKQANSSGDTTTTAQMLKMVSTSEVSVANVNGHESAKQALCRISAPSSSAVGSNTNTAPPRDALAEALVAGLESIPLVSSLAANVFSDVMKKNVALLFTTVKLLEFAAKASLDDSDDEETDEKEHSRTSGGAADSRRDTVKEVYFVHVHELLLHYLRPLS